MKDYKGKAMLSRISSSTIIYACLTYGRRKEKSHLIILSMFPLEFLITFLFLP